MNSFVLIAEGKQFVVEIADDLRTIVVDGVSVSAEILHQMVVAPNDKHWLRFARTGDVITVTGKFDDGNQE